MLTYQQTSLQPFRMAVKLEGRVVGHIHRPTRDAYFYRPKGASLAHCSGPFDTLEAAQESLA